MFSFATTTVNDINLLESWFERQNKKIGSSVQPTYVEKDNVLTFSLDLPGVKPGDIDVTAEDGRLTIVYVSRGVKKSQAYTVSSSYDLDSAKVTLDLGVLEVKVPLSEKRKGKKLVVQTK